VSVRIPPPNGPDRRPHQHITVAAAPGSATIGTAGPGDPSNTRRPRQNRPHAATAAASPANRVTDRPAGTA
jgi:hypothetical protein